MVSKYLLIITMILMQINYSLTLPVNSNKIIHGERQRRQAYNSIFRSLSPSLSFENPTSLFSYRMPEQPKWSFNTQTRGGNTLFTGDYRVNDRWSINPNLNLNHQLRPVGGGVGLTYRFKRSTDNENISKQNVNLMINDDDEVALNENNNDE